MYMQMTTISDFMSFSAWRNKAKLKSPPFSSARRASPIRTHFLKSAKIRNGVRTLLPVKIRLDTDRTMIRFFFFCHRRVNEKGMKNRQRYEDVVLYSQYNKDLFSYERYILLQYEKSIFSLIITCVLRLRIWISLV